MVGKSLILPLAVLQAPPPPRMFAKALTFSDVTGTPSSFADLVQLLGTFRRSDVVRWTSILIEVVSRNDGCSPPIQMVLIRDFLDSDLGKKALSKAREDANSVIFHRRQLWLVLQLSSVASNESTEPGDDQTVRHALGRACLLASDCLAKFEGVQALDSDDPKRDLQWLVTVMLSHAESNVPDSVLARAHAFWFDSLADPNVKKKFERLEIGETFDDIFLQEYGLTLREFIFIAETLYCSFAAPAMKPRVEPALINTSYPSDGLFSEEDKKRVFGAMSVNIVDMPALLLGTARQSWATDFSPLHAHPLIEIFSDNYVCPDLSFYASSAEFMGEFRLGEGAEGVI